MRHRPTLRMLVYLAGVLALAAAWLPAGAAGERVLTLEPASGPCAADSPPITLRGSGFTPGATLRFAILRERDGLIAATSSPAGGWPAAADGTIVRTLRLAGCGPTEPVGSTFRIRVVEGRDDPGVTATFTVTAATTGAAATPGPAATAPAVPGGVLPGLPNTGGGKATGLSWLWSLGVGLLLVTALGGTYVARHRASRGRD